MAPRAALELHIGGWRRRAIGVRHAADDPRPSDASVPAGASIPEAAHDVTILIVDDDPLMTDLLPRKLQRAMREGVRILTARAPDEAIALVRAEHPGIVVSDFNLRAAQNGLDVLATVASERPGAVRILFSAHTRREIGATIEGADIHGFVEKPMKLDELVTTLLDAIERATGTGLARTEAEG